MKAWNWMGIVVMIMPFFYFLLESITMNTNVLRKALLHVVYNNGG